MKTPKMVKSKSSKMHLEINNDMELDINNASMSRRNKKPKKSSSSTIKRKNPKTPKRMLSAKPKILAKKMRPSKRMTDKVTALKSKPMMASLLVKGKRVPVKVMKMSSGPETKGVAFSASRKNASVSRRTSVPKRKASTSRREASSSRRRGPAAAAPKEQMAGQPQWPAHAGAPKHSWAKPLDH